MWTKYGRVERAESADEWPRRNRVPIQLGYVEVCFAGGMRQKGNWVIWLEIDLPPSHQYCDARGVGRTMEKVVHNRIKC